MNLKFLFSLDLKRTLDPWWDWNLRVNICLWKEENNSLEHIFYLENSSSCPIFSNFFSVSTDSDVCRAAIMFYHIKQYVITRLLHNRTKVNWSKFRRIRGYTYLLLEGKHQTNYCRQQDKFKIWSWCIERTF